MVDYLDKLYSSIHDKNAVLVKLKYYSIQRFLLRVIANFLVPLYYNISKNKPSNLKNNSIIGDKRVIVSLTTFPPRIKKLWIVIESMLRQSHQPDKIVLWLSKEYFKSIDELPKSLRRLEKRGLEILLVDDDIRAHKKYFYSINKFPNDYIVTVDDDIIYPSFLISKLMKYNKLYPHSIICHRALRITAKGQQIDSYGTWKLLDDETKPSFNLFQTTGGGTLIPPHTLYQDVSNINLFKRLCLNSDDMWLNAMAQLADTTTVKTDYHSDCLPIINFKTPQLSNTNVGEGLNDIQLKAIREYYKKHMDIDPYYRLTSLN